MKMLQSAALCGVFVLTIPAHGAVAQGLGDVQAGMKFAQEVCASCHAIGPGAMFSPNLDAPTFQEIADVPGMTAIALTVALRTSHDTMPNFILNNDELEDIIAYILSLKSKQ